MKRAISVCLLLLWTASAQAQSLSVTWDASTDPTTTGYQVVWYLSGTGPGASSATVDVGNALTWALTPPMPTLSYCVVLRAYDTNHVLGGYSSEACSTPLTGGPIPPGGLAIALPTPTGVTATAGIQEIDVQWSPAPNTTAYDVLRATTTGGPYTPIIQGLQATAYLDHAVVVGTTYFYVIRGVPSGEASASPLPLPPPTTIVLDSLTPIQSSGLNATNLTYAVTVGTGPHRALVVGVASYAPAAISVGSLSYAGTPLTKIRRDSNGVNQAYSELWLLVNPPTGTANVVVTMTGAVGGGNAIRSAAAALTGVDPVMSVVTTAGSVVTGTHTGQSDPVNVTDGWIVDVLAAPSSATPGLIPTQSSVSPTADMAVYGHVTATAVPWAWASSGTASAHTVAVLKVAP